MISNTSNPVDGRDSSAPIPPELPGLLIVGTGDIARRALPQLLRLFRVTATLRGADRAQGLPPAVTPLLADLDRADSLAQWPAVDCLLHTAPPQLQGTRDERTRTLLAALDRAAAHTGGRLPRRVVYVSTSGVYGDCGGALVDESRPPNPGTDRARRRCDAEQVLGAWCTRHGATLVVLRAPGIYGDDRFPLQRLREGTPVLAREDDVYTNHIHADDLAAICATALDAHVPGGIYNTVDDSSILMGDWMDLVADAFGLPRPSRIRRSEAVARIPASLLSFMSESRRLVNARMKHEMGYVLRYPTVADGVRAAVLARKAA